MVRKKNNPVDLTLLTEQRLNEKRILTELSTQNSKVSDSQAASTKLASLKEENDYSRVNISSTKFSLRDIRPVTSKKVVQLRKKSY